MIAKAIASEAGVNFINVNGSDFEEMFVNLGATWIKKLFDEAKKKQPTIIFIDEFDSLASKRIEEHQYFRLTLNQLLSSMDGIDSSEEIIVIAATNFPDNLDNAVMRPGRFDRIINIPSPNY